MKKYFQAAGFWVMLACLAGGSVAAQNLTFAIERFEINGNSLLAPEQIDALVAPHTGQGRSFADVQLAQEALERAYRSRGFSAVVISLPEQDISSGVVRFNIVEARLDKLTVTGNQAFSEANIRRSLPALVSGEMPNAILMAENVGLANENPAKRNEVTLKISDQPGKVNAEVKVDEDKPQRWILNLDNSGQGSTTGDYRVGVAWQHANLFDRDQVLSLQYTTSPEQIKDVTLLNVGYHMPLYTLGDSVDVYAGYSNVDAGSFGAGSGIDGFVGKGRIAGVRYNQNLLRRGEYDHVIKYGLDVKVFESACDGLACGFVGSDVTAAPLSLSYQGNWVRPGVQTVFALTHLRNIDLGNNNKALNYAGATHQAGTIGAERRFSVWRFNVSQMNILPRGFQSRLSFSAQHTRDPLIAGEQFGLAGTNQVRGFNEREVARDLGQVLNLELFTPKLSDPLGIKVDDLRAVFFMDHGKGRYVRNADEISNGIDSASESIASIGFGLRMTHQKHYNLRLDLARVINAGGVQKEGDWMAHLLLSATF